MFAGIMLIYRGASVVVETPSSSFLKFLIGALGGFLFYFVLFRNISLKHILRIKNTPTESAAFYSFFNRKSYIMMISMISLGILLRKSGLIPMEYLAVFYICMGTPLFISSLRFFYHAYNFHKSSL